MHEDADAVSRKPGPFTIESLEDRITSPQQPTVFPKINKDVKFGKKKTKKKN